MEANVQNKLISVIMAICLLCSMYYLARTAVIYTMQQEKRGEQPVIVLDAGHGGEDPGKIGINGALEKDVNLQITMRLARLLQQNGYHVILTRNEDKGLYTGNQGSKKVEDLKNRIALIESSGAALAVSIHQNSYSAEGVCGAQVFYYETSEAGKEAAQIMQQELIRGVDPDNKRMPKGNNTYYLLKKSTVPTIIVECGFLSNQAEADKLVTGAYQERLAFYIAMAVMQYVSGIQKAS